MSEINRSASHSPEAAEQLTTMFNCPEHITDAVKERFKQLHQQEINEITQETQLQLSDVLSNQESLEVAFNKQDVINESQLAKYFSNKQKMNNLQEQLSNYFLA